MMAMEGNVCVHGRVGWNAGPELHVHVARLRKIACWVEDAVNTCAIPAQVRG